MHTLSLLGLLAFFLTTEAQNIEFRANASKTHLTVGERFKVEFSANANGRDFSPPSFSGFRVLSGPNPSTRMEMINGATSFNISYSYILLTQSEGEFELGPASLTVNGSVYHSNPIRRQMPRHPKK